LDRAVHDASLAAGVLYCRFGAGAIDAATGDCRRDAEDRQPHAEAPKAASALPPTAPEVQKLLKPLMNRGTNMEVAADGFHSAEQFATVAHAAKNTGVPFMVLKHRVLNQGKPLSTAIRESKPDINVAAEASLALGQARRDISSLAA
jgi:hypothetical protein